MLGAVISLETFHFVERHEAELTNVPSFTPFFVSCTNMAVPSRILPLALFSFHDFLEYMFPHITRKAPMGLPMRPTWGVS
jgi:hypothetical protein